MLKTVVYVLLYLNSQGHWREAAPGMYFTHDNCKEAVRMAAKQPERAARMRCVARAAGQVWTTVSVEPTLFATETNCLRFAWQQNPKLECVRAGSLAHN